MKGVVVTSDFPLASCPFCREPARMRRYRFGSQKPKHQYFTVECSAEDRCALVVETKFADTPAEAVAYWNNRPPEVPCPDSTPCVLRRPPDGLA